MKIIYVHHGNRKVINETPTENDDLTEIGYKDCELVAELLNNPKIKENVKAIYTSPVFRCQKTAEIINKGLNVPIFEDSRLKEFKRMWEDWIDLQTRVQDCIDEIVSKYDDNDIVICVTSGVNVCAFINKAYGIKPSSDAPILGLSNCCPIIFNYKK